MSDLIRREDALTIIERLRDRCDNDEMAFALNWAAGIIRDMTAVDAVEVKHGEWEKRMNIGVLTWCSECGWMKHQEDERKYNYCPNCGAKMDRRREDGDT